MFEDSTFESACRIHTRSRQWMVAAFAFNASILMAFIVIPLVCPPSLSRQFNTFMMESFVPPKPQPQQPLQTARPSNEMPNNPFAAPSKIPTTTYIPDAPEPAIIIGSSTSLTDPGNDLFRRLASGPAVRPGVQAPLHISTLVEEGLLIEKRMPVYPVIAKTAGISGTVTLAAVISKTGTIENLRVISGPMMLQQAARDAVQTWRYRPYLLDGQPVEVETTVSVIFTLQQ